jgi:xanthine permease
MQVKVVQGTTIAQSAEVNARLSAGRTTLLGLQHVLAMYAGAVAVPLIVGNSIGLTKAQIAFLIQADLFTCGIATLIQSMGIGSRIGIRLPTVLGVTFAAVTPIISIGKSLGMPAVYGAVIISGILVYFLAPFVGALRRFFPPVVTGCVITIIGISLLPVAINWSGGGVGATDFGAGIHLALALLVLVFAMVVSIAARGFLASIAVLLGLVMGTLAAGFLGRANLDLVKTEPWLSITTPFWFGAPRFDWAAILTMTLVAIVSMLESTGVYFALGQIAKVQVQKSDIAAGLRAEGVAITIGGILNSFPYTSFSQNVGLVKMTGVRSRRITSTAGVILIFLGLLPKFAALVASIPAAVLGGVGVLMFGMVMVAGMETLATVDFSKMSNQVIMAVSIGIGCGVSVVPGIFSGLHSSVSLILSNGIVIGSVLAVVLNAALNRQS